MNSEWPVSKGLLCCGMSDGAKESRPYSGKVQNEEIAQTKSRSLWHERNPLLALVTADSCPPHPSLPPCEKLGFPRLLSTHITAFHLSEERQLLLGVPLVDGCACLFIHIFTACWFIGDRWKTNRPSRDHSDTLKQDKTFWQVEHHQAWTPSRHKPQMSHS